MSSIVPAANYSLYAIPAFYVLNLAPHIYGVNILKKANNGTADKANPRAHFQSLKTSTPREIYDRYQRAEAAHTNGFENLPLIAAAIICGNMARLDPSTLNTVAGVFLTLRTAYIIAYIRTTTQNWSLLRSGIWMSSVGCCFYLLGKAGSVMANGGPLAL
ncbi:MAG: hypothetical protein HETSPECPRED_006798 [Heterodermia speciosa]|uniref:Uncharacterized protein n=1 Tax=Heterodermia speciosa TaxID=116794 RepID=A0A8H3FLQ5_9LECA|nr:MAG: hypothetical protein HETSPECPRED_006798 [Heterodermia speciosa]